MPKKSPSRLSYPQREERILKAATRLFSEKGFKGATTKALAREAGINEALIFRHFSQKSQLYSALLKKKLEEVEEDFASELHDIFQKPLEEGLLLLARRIVSRFKKDLPFIRMMLFSALENHPLSRLVFRQRLPLPETLKRFFLEKTRSEGDNAPNPEIAAKAFFGMLFHYAMITLIFRADDYFPMGENELLQSYVRTFTRGVAS